MTFDLIALVYVMLTEVLTLNLMNENKIKFSYHSYIVITHLGFDIVQLSRLNFIFLTLKHRVKYKEIKPKGDIVERENK